MFDDQRLAARAAASAMHDTVELEARLLPDGHVALLDVDLDPAATWQILGCTPQEGCVVRAEVAGASWVTRIERAWLARQDREVRVILERQSDPQPEPLRGWILFC
jgi:hypothetical protein